LTQKKAIIISLQGYSQFPSACSCELPHRWRRTIILKSGTFLALSFNINTRRGIFYDFIFGSFMPPPTLTVAG